MKKRHRDPRQFAQDPRTGYDRADHNKGADMADFKAAKKIEASNAEMTRQIRRAVIAAYVLAGSVLILAAVEACRVICK